MLSRDPVVEELSRRLVAERGVTTTPVLRKNSLKHVCPPDSTRDGAHPALVEHSRRDVSPAKIEFISIERG